MSKKWRDFWQGRYAKTASGAYIRKRHNGNQRQDRWWKGYEYQRELNRSAYGIEEINEGSTAVATTHTSRHDPYYGLYYDYGTYDAYAYRPKVDLSITLATRIRQLIGTITGEVLELIDANGWGMDKKYIYYNEQELYDATDDRVLGQILHQLALRQYLPLTKVAQLKKAEPQHQPCLTALESIRADYRLQDFYPGCHYYREVLWQEHEKSKLEETQKELKIKAAIGENIGWDMNTYNPRHITTLGRDSLLRNIDWDLAVRQLAAEPSAQPKFTNKSDQANWLKAIPLIRQYQTAADWQQAKTLYDQIKRLWPELNENAQKTLKHFNGQYGYGTTGNRFQGELTQQEKRQAKRKAKQEEQKSCRRGGLDETEPPSNTTDLAEYEKIRKEMLPQIQLLTRLLQSILRDNREKRYIRPFRRGKLDKRGMAKLITQNNLRCFKQPREIKQKDYGFALLIDQSGSMFGQRIDNAIKAAIVMAETLNELNIPFLVMGFNHTTRLYKKFTGSIRRSELIRHLWYTGGGTNDYKALQETSASLEKLYRLQQTAVFVMTDGCGYDSSLMLNAIQQLKERDGHVIGIGIEMNPEDLAQSYPAYTCPQNIEKLPNELGRLIAAQFRRV